MTKIQAEIIAQGTVQKVAYRDHVQDTARKLNIKGYVENLRDGSVRIICETDQHTLNKFLQLINTKQHLINVENIEIAKTQPATDQYQYFDIKYGPLQEEIGERMVAAFKIATATRQDIQSMHKDLDGSIQSMHEDMKVMHKDLKGGIDSMHEDMKVMHKDLKGGIDSMHEDMKVMHKDLDGSIQSMHKGMKGGIDSMHEDMNRNFKEMGERYDAISAELLRTREELRRSVDNLVKVIQKFLEKPPST